VTRERMHLEALEQVMANVDKVVIDDSAGSGVLPLLQLPVGGTTNAQQPAAAQPTAAPKPAAPAVAPTPTPTAQPGMTAVPQSGGRQ
jgi:hypothetical protein